MIVFSSNITLPEAVAQIENKAWYPPALHETAKFLRDIIFEMKKAVKPLPFHCMQVMLQREKVPFLINLESSLEFFSMDP